MINVALPAFWLVSQGPCPRNLGFEQVTDEFITATYKHIQTKTRITATIEF